jgi:hypothetical protein
LTVYKDQIWTKSNCREFENSNHRVLKDLIKNDQSKVVYLVDACEINPDVTYITDNILAVPYIGLHPEFWGGFFYEPSYISRIPNKLFNCFINRVCPFRQSWFYQLIRHDLLDQGAVSYLLDYRCMPTECKTKIQLNEWIYNQGNSIFKNEHDFIKDQVPFCNFSDDLDQTIVDTKVGVVIETYFEDHAIAFSEKTFRSLQLPRPFMLFASRGAVQVLIDYGFDLYCDIIDHSYDNEPDPVTRQMLIIEQLDLLKSLEYNSIMLDEFEQRARHNQDRLKYFLSKWPEKLKSIEQLLNSSNESLP